MKNEAELRHDISHIRVLVGGSTDSAVRAELELLIQELEERLRQMGNGVAILTAPNSVWWPVATQP